MPKIGRLNIPEDFFEKLAEGFAIAFINEVILYGNVQNDIDIKGDAIRVGLSDNLYTWEYLAALIRVQTHDWISSDDAIEESSDYKLVMREAMIRGKQIAYDRISPDRALLAIAQEYEPLDLQPPLTL